MKKKTFNKKHRKQGNRGTRTKKITKPDLKLTNSTNILTLNELTTEVKMRSLHAWIKTNKTELYAVYKKCCLNIKVALI